MHGLIHRVFKDFIVSKFEASTWEEILSKAGIEDENSILEMKQYGDELTFAAIGIACNVLDVEVPVALELFGAAFVDYVVAAGFYNQLASVGRDLFDCLTNINLLHHNLKRDMRNASFPVFTVESKSEKNDVFQLRYSSSRIGLEGLLRGVLIKATRELFNAKLEIVVVKSPQYSGIPRAAHQNEDTSVVLDLHVGELLKDEPSKEAPKKKVTGLSFFDLHAFFASCCQTGAEMDSEIACSPVPEVCAKPSWTQPQDSEIECGPVSEVCAMPSCTHPQVICSQPSWKGRAEKEMLTKEMALASCSPTAAFERAAALMIRIPTLKRIEGKIKISKLLFRCVTAAKVGAEWQDNSALEQVAEFWEGYDKLDEYYTWSTDVLSEDEGRTANRPVTFISHSWQQPDSWEYAMGSGCSYAHIKAAEICGFAKDLAASKLGDPSRWREVCFWVDKCCIPQGSEKLMDQCVGLLEEFIILSDNLVVVLSWSYFERLWCVYEWACFLLHHKPSSIHFCSHAFIRSRTQPLLVESIKNFSLDKCKCSVESDREVLTEKVGTYYVSSDAFERFLKFTSIALIARDMARHRIDQGKGAILPWSQLALDCGFQDLAGHLRSMSKELTKWNVACQEAQDSQTAIFQKVESWFEANIEPLIEELRSSCLTPRAQFLSSCMLSEASTSFDSGLNRQTTPS